ncbi:tetratricopeptide repeat protein [Agaribacter flavus]|uniref:Tetratricopeptide repeat protein n=1 Tax=Agaribacter flavus TaxID=1902781 RepID=A0ABV7FST7_9ALTE
MDNASKLERLTKFWDQDPTNLSLCADIIAECAVQKNESYLRQFYLSLNPEISKLPQIVWQYGRSLVELGKIVEGAEEFAKLPDDGSETKPYSIALCLFLQAKFIEANSTIDNYVSTIGKYSSVQLMLLHAKVNYHLGELEVALTLAKQIHQQLGKQSSSHAELLGLLAMLHFDLTHIEESLAYAKQLLETSPKHHDGLLALASIHAYKQELEQAISVANTGVSEFSNSGRMWSVLAQALFAMGDREAAYNCVVNATKLMPNHIGTWHVRAWCELVNGDIQSASSSFHSALAINRNFGDSHAGLALVAFTEQKYDEAKRILIVAQRLDPNSVTAKYVESLLLSRLGKEQDAEQMLDTLLEQPSHLTGLSYKQLISAINR